MAFSSSITKFIHFPISISPPNSNSKNYNPASPYTRSTYRPPPPAAKRRGYLCVKCNGGNDIDNDNDNDNDNDDKTLKRVHKIYEVIKNKNISQLSEVLADECPDAYNSIPFLRILRAKLKVLEFFSHLNKTLGNSLKFKVKPTIKDGSLVGVKWKLGWEKTVVTLGKGVNIESHHSYIGKLLIGNLETMVDHPFLQPKIMRLMDLMNLVPKQRRLASMCLGFFLIVLSLFFFQFSVP